MLVLPGKSHLEVRSDIDPPLVLVVDSYRHPARRGLSQQLAAKPGAWLGLSVAATGLTLALVVALAGRLLLAIGRGPPTDRSRRRRHR